jgi:hypothetical protein
MDLFNRIRSSDNCLRKVCTTWAATHLRISVYGCLSWYVMEEDEEGLVLDNTCFNACRSKGNWLFVSKLYCLTLAENKVKNWGAN